MNYEKVIHEITLTMLIMVHKCLNCIENDDKSK